MTTQTRPSFWEYTKKSARDATREFFDPLIRLTPLFPNTETRTPETVPPTTDKAEVEYGSVKAVEANPTVAREIDRSGVRIYSHLVDRPLEQDIVLRHEPAVERRFANRPVTADDFAPRSGSIELRGSGEETAYGRSKRVVEEVLIGKSTGEHTHTMTDTVRRTEVDEEEIPRNLVGRTDK